MSSRRRWVRLLLGPALAAVIICAPFAIASAVPNLSNASAAQVLASIAKSTNIKGYTGMLTQISNLGLPDLSGGISGLSNQTTADTDPLTQTLTLLGANQRARISMSPTGARFQLYKADGEQDLVLDRGNLWVWDYTTQAVTRINLPTVSNTVTKKLAAIRALATPAKPLYTPQELATAFINGLDSHTRVSAGTSRYVAHRAAYTVVFTPREANTLVGSIQIAVDAQTGMVLQFTIYAKGSTTPAYQLGYSDITYAQPNPATFKFTPPPKTKVKTLDYTLPVLTKQVSQTTSGATGNTTLTGIGTILGGIIGVTQTVKVSGTGWASILSLPKNTLPISGNKLLQTITTAGQHGTRTLSTSLLNIAFSPDGSVRLGAVPLNDLQ